MDYVFLFLLLLSERGVSTRFHHIQSNKQWTCSHGYLLRGQTSLWLEHWARKSIVTPLQLLSFNTVNWSCLVLCVYTVLYRRRWIFPRWSVWRLPIIWLGQTGKGARLERFQRDDWSCCFTVLPLRAIFEHVVTVYYTSSQSSQQSLS